MALHSLEGLIRGTAVPRTYVAAFLSVHVVPRLLSPELVSLMAFCEHVLVKGIRGRAPGQGAMSCS